MGSFNVGCGISSISIGCGTRTKLIFLIPNSYRGSKCGEITIEPTINYVSNDGAMGFYAPVALPIEGVYNDYGSLEDIKRDSNVEALEKFFKMDIDKIVDIASCGRGTFDSFGAVFPAYGIIPDILAWGDNGKKKITKDMFEKMEFEVIGEQNDPENGLVITYTHKAIPTIPINPKEVPDWINDRVTPERMEERKAAIKHNQESPQEPKFNVTFNVKTGEIKMVFLNGEEQSFTDSYDKMANFMSQFYEATAHVIEEEIIPAKVPGYILNVKQEDQAKVKYLTQMSGMFMHADVYDALVNFSRYKDKEGSLLNGSSLYPEVLEQMGFKFSHKEEKFERYNKIYVHPKVEDYWMCSDGTWAHMTKKGSEEQIRDEEFWGTYHPNQLFGLWKKLTGVELDNEENFKNTSVYEPTYQKILEKCKKVKDLPDLETVKLALSKMKEGEVEDLENELGMTKDELLDSLFALIDIEYDDGRSMGLYSKFPLFMKLYREIITEDREDLKNEIINFNHFYWAFFSNNKVFMPTVNGEQFGNPEATLALANITKKLMEDQIKEYEEDEE